MIHKKYIEISVEFPASSLSLTQEYGFSGEIVIEEKRVQQSISEILFFRDWEEFRLESLLILLV